MIFLVLLMPYAILAVMTGMAFDKIRKQIEKLSSRNDRSEERLSWIEETVSSRILKLEAPESDEPPLLPRGEVREVVRSYKPTYKEDGWIEILKAAQKGYRCDINAIGRGEFVISANDYMEACNRAMRAARVYVDAPGEITKQELENALRAAGLETSRKSEP